MTRSETCFRFHDFRATHSRENADFRNHANHLQSAPCRRSSAVEPSLHVAGHVGGCDRRLCSGDAADHHGPCAHCLRRSRMSGQTGRLRRSGGLSGRRATCRWLAVPFSGRRPRRDAPCRSCRRAEAVDAHTDHALAARQTASQAHRLRPGGAQTARHLQPFPAANRMASMTTRFEIRAFPRWFGGRGRKMAY